MNQLDKICQQCGLYETAKPRSPNIQPHGSSSPLVYILGATANRRDDVHNEHFANSSYDKFLSIFSEFKIDPQKEVRYYKALNCYAHISTKDQLVFCAQKVRADIECTRPKVILAMGSEAVKALWPQMGAPVMSRMRGSAVPYLFADGAGCTVVVTHTLEYARKFDKVSMAEVWMDDVYDLCSYAVGEFGCRSKLKEQGIIEQPKEIICISNEKQFREFFAEIQDQEKVAWDYETIGLHPWSNLENPEEIPPQLYTAAFAFSDSEKAYMFPLYKAWSGRLRTKIFESLAKWIFECCPDQIKIAHSLKFEMIWSHVILGQEVYPDQYPEELIPCGKYHDTILMAWLLDGRAGASKLKYCGWKTFGLSDWGDSINKKNILANRLEDVLEYNWQDAWWTLKYFDYASPLILDHPAYSNAYNNVMMPASFAFTYTEVRGTPIDLEYREELKVDLSKQISGTQEEVIKNLDGYKMDIGSPKQLSKYFAEDRNYKMLKKLKTQYSTDEESLLYLVDKYDDQVAKSILEHRKVMKLQSTYVEGLSKVIYDDEQLHANYNIIGPETGRTSSSDPNVQNFPNRKNKHIRGQIIAPEGYILVSFDYGQIEARLFAVITGDENFIQALYNGLDIHLDNAKILFGDTQDAIDNRPNVKNGTFAMFYGAGDFKIAKTIGISIRQVERLREIVFGRFPDVIEWMKMINRFYKEHGYVESLFGKRRRAPMDYTQILNHTNQSTASDMTQVAMNCLYQLYWVLLMIHDDLSILIKDDERFEERVQFFAKAMLAIPWQYMHKSPFFKEWVPLSVECAAGPDWYNLEKKFTISSLEADLKTLDDSLQFSKQIVNYRG